MTLIGRGSGETHHRVDVRADSAFVDDIEIECHIAQRDNT
jgi:hypothetical protein